MPSEWVQRQVDRFLAEAAEALAADAWGRAQARGDRILRLDPLNADAASLLVAAAHPSSPTLLPQGEKGDRPADPPVGNWQAAVGNEGVGRRASGVGPFSLSPAGAGAGEGEPGVG